LQVFDSVSELVQSALDGYHVCLFSYGQTGAGKTYTMSGGNTPEHQGLMPRAVNQVRASSTACWGICVVARHALCFFSINRSERPSFLW
jgi:hypothetical protein